MALRVGVADLGRRGLGISGVDLLEGEVAANGVGQAAFVDQEAGVAEGQGGGQEAVQPRVALGGRMSFPILVTG